MTQVVGQPTPQQQAVAGAGSAPAQDNPWAAYGLNPDGTPIEQQQGSLTPEELGQRLVAENQALLAKVQQLEGQLAQMPDDPASVKQKLAMVDRLVEAVKGDAPEAKGNRYQEIYRDLKDVARVASPGLSRLLEIMDQDPAYLDKVQRGMGAVAAQHVIGMNERAHTTVLDLAKRAGFKGTEAEMNELVLPFEQSMTVIINGNPELKRAFVSGNMKVVEDLFTRLIKPHVAMRLKDKQARLNRPIPGAAPVGGAAPAGVTENQVKRDLTTPKGRAQFHRDAVGRWLSRSSRSEE